MSEDPTPYAVVQGKILQLASAPFTPRQHEAWLLEVCGAYRDLSHNRAMRLVLEHLTVTVLLNPEADEGARRLYIEMLQFMNTQNQLGMQPREDGNGLSW